MFDQLCSLWVLIVSQSMLIASHLLPLNVSTPCSRCVIHRAMKIQTGWVILSCDGGEWKAEGKGRVKRKREREIGRGVCLELFHPRFVHQCDPGGQ